MKKDLRQRQPVLGNRDKLFTPASGPQVEQQAAGAKVCISHPPLQHLQIGQELELVGVSRWVRLQFASDVVKAFEHVYCFRQVARRRVLVVIKSALPLPNWSQRRDMCQGPLLVERY